MDQQELYLDTVRRLAALGYEVRRDKQDYIIQHLNDSDDISRVRGLNELIELADLFEWREQRWRAPQGNSNSAV